MKDLMKYMLAAAIAMVGIIAVQAILSCVFTAHVGEVFSRTAVSALFYYTLIWGMRKRREAAR